MSRLALALGLLLSVLTLPAQASNAPLTAREAIEVFLPKLHALAESWRIEQASTRYPTEDEFLGQVLNLGHIEAEEFPDWRINIETLPYRVLAYQVSGKDVTPSTFLLVVGPCHPASIVGTYAIAEDGIVREAPKGIVYPEAPRGSRPSMDARAWPPITATLDLAAHRLEALRNRALLTLRSLASAQLAFAAQQEDGHYGTWEALVNDGFLLETHTRRSISEGYDIVVFRPKTDLDGTQRFVIIAVPMGNETADLPAYAIDEQQSIRVAPPGVEFARDDYMDVSAWPPYADDVSGRTMSTEEQERAAVQTLRALGQDQLAYRERHPGHTYGMYEDLVLAGFLPVGVRRETLISGYHLKVSLAGFSSQAGQTFLLIATPVAAGTLPTLAIAEDQVVRVAPEDAKIDPMRPIDISKWKTY